MNQNSQPTKMGKYELRRELGRGSMGVVYEAFDPYIGRLVAVKVAIADALKHSDSGERFRKMFFNEAHTAGRLRHPNILDIFDAGVDKEKCYIVMEIIDGADTLKPYCRPDNLLPLNQVADILFRCAKALDYAHRQGVIHRDIKPSNILLTRAMEAKIADFSIAHINRTDLSQTMPLGFVGSPRYMSPEQVQEDMITSQTDLFSLGVVAYELFTGHHPFGAESFTKLIHSVVHEEPIPMTQYRPELPSAVQRIVSKALEKQPERRYRTGIEIAADLSVAFSHLQRAQEGIPARDKFQLIKNLHFFRGFTEGELWEIVRASVWLDVPQGDAVIREGQIDDAVYIITAGEASVTKQGHVLQRLVLGECFGEMAYLRKIKRTATVTAETPLSLMKLNASLLEQVAPACQLRFYQIFTTVLIDRLITANESLTQA